MKLPDFDPVMLVVLAGAAVIKILTSKALTFRSGILTAFMAVFAGYVFTDPVAFYLGVEEESVKYGLAALLALTGEGFMRIAMEIAGDRGLVNTVVEGVLDRLIGRRDK